MKKVVKYPLYGFIALVVILIVAIPLIPADRYRQELEIQISQALGLDVRIGDVYLSTLPQPNLSAEVIELRDDDVLIVSADKIEIVPVFSSLFSDTPGIREVNLSGVTLDLRKLGILTASDKDKSQPTKTKSEPISIQRIRGNDSYLLTGDKQRIGPLSFTLDLKKDLKLQSLELSFQRQAFQMNVLPKGEDFLIDLQAQDWTIPHQTKLVFNKLNVTGVLQPQRFHAKSIQATAYQGTLDGNLIVEWKNDWVIDSRLEINGLDLGKLLERFDNHSMDGTGSGQIDIRSQGSEASQLSKQYRITGDAKIINGHLYNTDLEQAARTLSKEWKSGGQTPFDEFQSHIDMDASEIRLSEMRIRSTALGAKGHLNIGQDDSLKGQIKVGLNEPTGILTMPLKVSGTIDEPKVRPTDAALAGGAVGTAVLGPGVGTAVGVKAGEMFDKIGNFFGSDDKKDQTKQNSSESKTSKNEEDSD